MTRIWLVLMLLLCCPQASAWAGEAGEISAAERPKAINSTEAAPPQAEGRAIEAAPPPAALEVVGGDKLTDKQLGLRHLMTYEPLEKKTSDYDQSMPDKIFFLTMEGFTTYGADAVIETNAGFGVFRGEIGTSSATMSNFAEITCYKDYGDDCSPEAIVVYGITGTDSDYTPRIGRRRVDLMNLVYQRVGTPVVIQSKNGAMPQKKPALTVAGSASSKEIQIAYFMRTGGPLCLLSLTFPLGEGKEYSAVRLITSAGYADMEFAKMGGTILRHDPRRPDILLVEVTSTDWRPDWYTGRESIEDDRDPGDPIIIYEAKALRRGRWENILPRLVHRPLVQLPIHSKSGPLLEKEDFQ